MGITYTLGVASPLVYNPKVERAQKILNGGNVYGKDFLRGAVDGQFGEETGRACIRAKYWLGYPTKELKPTFGPHLDSFLHGLEQPTKEMLRRTELRQAQIAERPLREKAFERLMTKLGYTENPGNDNIFGIWYGMNEQPYCAMAGTWAYVGVGSKAFVRGSRYAYCPYVVQDARAGRYGLSVTHDPRRGDPVLYDWDGGVADHFGMFDKWMDKSKGYFRALEANTSPDDSGSQSNGGGVFLRGERPGKGDTRKLSQVECFVRVGR